MRSARLLAPVLVASVLLTGCFTGKRAHFATDATTTLPPVPDAAIQAVIDNLQTPNAAQFTAGYNILVKYGALETTAIVAQNAPDAQSITIGNVRFLTNGSLTCDVPSGVCQEGLLDQTTSDLQLTHDFYSTSAVKKLRQDATTMVAAATASTRQIAGSDAVCAEIPFAAGTKLYCALENGLLALQETPDVRIELTTFNVGADVGLFAPPSSILPSTTGP